MEAAVAIVTVTPSTNDQSKNYNTNSQRARRSSSVGIVVSTLSATHPHLLLFLAAVVDSQFPKLSQGIRRALATPSCKTVVAVAVVQPDARVMRSCSSKFRHYREN